MPPPARKPFDAVDDTEMLLISVEDILTTTDPKLRITTALSASEGLREIERLIPDLVLLDYSLPDFNGDELCERLLENERTAHVPVLMMPGHVVEMNAAAARFPTIVAKIEKPIFSDAFVDLVQRTLETEQVFERLADEEPVAPTIFESNPTPLPAPKKALAASPSARTP